MHISPVIWRRIQVPSRYTFWDLHVVIQDSMGWFDYHLHAFYVRMPRKRKIQEIGIPGDFCDEPVVPGWEVPVVDYFVEPGKSAPYLYDFGDGWEHLVLLEGILLKEKGVKYPRCVAGERACPPEDCGGVLGYEHLLEILKNPNHPEYEFYVTWLQRHVTDYYPFDPDFFDPEEVEFWNPKTRWRMAFARDSN